LGFILGVILKREIDPFGVICRLGTTRHSISHTRKWLKQMRNQNGIDSYRGSTFSQIGNRLSLTDTHTLTDTYTSIDSHTHTHRHTYTHTRTQRHTHTHADKHTRTHTHILTRTHTHTHTHTHTRAHTHTQKHTHTRVYSFSVSSICQLRREIYCLKSPPNWNMNGSHVPYFAVFFVRSHFIVKRFAETHYPISTGHHGNHHGVLSDVCIIWITVYPSIHMDVVLPSHSRYERRIGNLFEVQNVSWSYCG
jgi:hypothetical protein